MSLIFACMMAVVVDGDTLRCANIEQRNGRVRLARINAPELTRGGGEEAKAFLEGLLVGEVTCEQVDASPQVAGFQETDPYGRIVARCTAQGHDLGGNCSISASSASSPVARTTRQPTGIRAPKSNCSSKRGPNGPPMPPGGGGSEPSSTPSRHLHADNSGTQLMLGSNLGRR